MKKIIITLLCLASLSAGCSKKQTPIKESVTPAPTVKTEQTLSNASVFLNLEDEFVPLKDTIIDSPLLEVPENYSGGSFDATLYDDKKVTVQAVYDEYDITLSVIEGQHVTLYAEALQSIHIVDLNKNDNLYEIAVCSDGASCDPAVSFLRFDGKNLYPISFYNSDSGYMDYAIYGDITADEKDVLPTYGAIWTNQNGRVVTSFQNMGFTDSRIALSCFDIVEQSWVETNFEKPKLPIKLTVSEDFEAFFTPCNTVPTDFDNEEYVQGFNLEGQRKFTKGQSIELIDFGEIYNYYAFYVDIDGEKGVIAFWLGD